MKSIKKPSFFILLLFVGLLSSCEKDPCYSCNEEINSWAKDNIAAIRLMTKPEITMLSLEKQRAAFRTFTPKKKKSFWSEKIKDVKKMAISDKELQHLNLFEKFIDDFAFTDDITIEQEKYLFDWFDEGKEMFGWTDYFRISGFMLLGKVVKNEKEFKELYAEDMLSYISKPSNRNDITLKELLTINVANAEACDSQWCYDCELIGGTCYSGCTETTSGCGWAWSQSCTKNCSPY